MELEAALLGGLLPAAVSALALVLGLRWGGRLSEAMRRVGAAAALGGGYLVGWLALWLTWAPNTPSDPWRRLPYLALVAVLVGLHDLTGALERSRLGRLRAALAAFLRAWRSDQPGVLGWTVRLVVSGVSAWLLVPTHEAGRFEWIAGLAAFMLLLWAGLDPLSRTWTGPLLPVLLAVVAGEVAALLFLVHIAPFAQLAGILAAVLIGAAVVAWQVPSVALVRGMVPGIAVLVPGWLASGRFQSFSEVQLPSYLLLAVAPLALVVARPLRRPTSLGVRIGQVALALAPGLVALALAWRQAGGLH